MLVLGRKEGESIMIGKDIVVTFVEQQGTRNIRVGIKAPKHMAIHRTEVYERSKSDEQS